VKKFLSIAAVLGLGLGLAACKHGLSAKEQDVAKYGALQFANTMQGRFLSCMSVDTDNDGTVDCEVQLPGGISRIGRGLELTPIQCSYSGHAGKAGCTIKR
jgi:hypothetical protein